MSYSFILLLLAPIFYCHRLLKNLSYKLSPSIYSPTKGPYDLWLHGASVGELNLTMVLVDELLRTNPALKIIITFNTATAANHATSIINKQGKHKYKHIAFSYAPYDLPFAINRFLNSYSPALLITLEAELWRNTSIIAHRRQLPIILANARLTAKSARARSKFKFAMPPAKCLPKIIAAQSQEDASNFRNWYATMQATPPQVKVCGNIKFDAMLQTPKQSHNSSTLNKLQDLIEGGKVDTQGDAKGDAKNDTKAKSKNKSSHKRVIWCGASTHHPEEDMLLDAMSAMNEMNVKSELHQQPNLLILAPRHPHRFNQVAAKLKARGFDFVRFSDLVTEVNATNATPATTDNPNSTETYIHKLSSCQVLLLDTLGDLPHIYPLASFAFVGGSFTERGGQNILEPLMSQAAVILGPKHHNLKSILSCFAANAATDHPQYNPQDHPQDHPQYPSYISVVQSRVELIQKINDTILLAARSSTANPSHRLAIEAPAIISSHTGVAAKICSIIETCKHSIKLKEF